MKERKYLTVHQVSKELALSTRGVMNLIRDGKLIGYRLNKSEIRLKAEDITAFIDASRILGDAGYRFTGRGFHRVSLGGSL
jgi:excisionase family DNA binding protein